LVPNPEQDLTGVSEVFLWLTAVFGFLKCLPFAVDANFHLNLFGSLVHEPPFWGVGSEILGFELRA
jgi:hypothetical protein